MPKKSITTFDVLDSILYKRGKPLTAKQLEGVNMSPYFFNNWISAYNEDVLRFINETANKDASVLKNRKMIYEYYRNVLPKLVFKKIEYPKPEKIDKGDEIDAMSDEELELYQDNIKYYAEKLEISEKEVKYLVGRNLLNIKI
jgi:hypothetical protein